jgi:negative regulator of sigma-B (phosphoserine phosphatase)
VKLAAEYLTVAKEGETENGDAAVVRRWDDRALLAVIDALGHGAPAAAAAATATAYLDAVTPEQGLREIMDGLHERLRGTRGAAAMVLLVGEGRVQGCGVGNVELRAYKGRVPAVLSPGVLGASISRLHFFEARPSASERIVVFSDGIAARFYDDDAARGLPVAETCRVIMDRHRRPHDDATVLVTDIEVLQ